MNMALEFWPSARRQRRAYPAQWVCKELAIPARRERPKEPARLYRLFLDGPHINLFSTATKRLPHILTIAIYASPNRHAINIYHFYNKSLRHRPLSAKTKTLRYPASPAVNPRRVAPRSEKPLRTSALRQGCRNLPALAGTGLPG